MKKTDYLIIGAGIAGLSAALNLKELGKVTVVTKGKLKQAMWSDQFRSESLLGQHTQSIILLWNVPKACASQILQLCPLGPLSLR